MCEIMTALAIGSAVFGAVGQIQAANQSAAMQKYNAEVADQNAGLARQEAFARQQQIRAEGDRVLASQAAAFGKAGLQLDAGTPLIVASRTAEDIAYDEELARYQGDVEAISYRNQSRALKSSAKSTRTAGYIGAGATLLSGGVQTWQGLNAPVGGSTFGRKGYSSGQLGGRGMMVGGV